MSHRNLILILGDQLSLSISSLKGFDPRQDGIIMVESRELVTNVKHHKKKIAYIFSCMRHFAQSLLAKGYSVRYVELDDPQHKGSLSAEVLNTLKLQQWKSVLITQPSEYNQLQMVREWQKQWDTTVDILEDDRFLCTKSEFAQWAGERKQLRMEFFYREMRKKYDILMDGTKPIGGKWNYDAENRKPPKEGLDIPPTYHAKPDQITQSVINMVKQNFNDHFGDLEPFYFAVTRKQALYALNQFVEQRLARFGDFQDAMIQGEPWMFHAHISFYLNNGLLTPMECVEKVEDAFHSGFAPLNAVEGFIRQIVGWREYIRGIYWLRMPEYESENFFNAKRDLPEFYWTADTKMNCLSQCVQETKHNAYAHHIQRLMVLGNFALIAGLDPKQVNEWYWIVYADAYQWVELPNVSGMILFADGGYLASKPYAAGGAYINKMSNYCQDCFYKVNQKNGKEACPFNYLYWDFLQRNRDQLSSNHRIGMMYNTYDRMSEEKQLMIREDSRQFLDQL